MAAKLQLQAAAGDAPGRAAARRRSSRARHDAGDLASRQGETVATKTGTSALICSCPDTFLSNNNINSGGQRTACSLL